MNAGQPIPWTYLKTTIIRFAPFWGSVTLLFGGIGAAYSLVKPDAWQASQPLLIRDEATGSVQRLGRFASQTELMAAQATILEMARHREVVGAALRLVGPPEGAALATWPSSKMIDDVASRNINVRAPKTSEFGKTEVVYLVTQAETPQRAERLCQAVYSALADHLRNVRRVRADSVVAELVAARDLAQENLDAATEELARLEASVGMDLGELRSLSESVTGEASSSRVLSEVQRDLRLAELELQRIESLQTLLQRSYENPQHLLISEGDLLATQPTLQRLKSGLIDSQLLASQLSGQLTAEHPRMRAAELAQATIQEELREEIRSVSQSMGPSLALAQQKVTRLQAKERDIQDKLARLAAIRTEYARRVAAVKHRTELMSTVQAELAEAEASRAAALSTNLLSELGPARADETPVGPGGSVITAAALVAGLMFGFGGVFLVAPGPVGNGGTRFGRRWNDIVGGRRATDAPQATAWAPPATAPNRRRDEWPAVPAETPPSVEPHPSHEPPAPEASPDTVDIAIEPDTTSPAQSVSRAQDEIAEQTEASAPAEADELAEAPVQTQAPLQVERPAPQPVPERLPETTAVNPTPVITSGDAARNQQTESPSTAEPDKPDASATQVWNEPPLTPPAPRPSANEGFSLLPFQDVNPQPNPPRS